MNIYEFTPQKNMRKLALLTGALFGGAAVIMAMTVLLGEMSYRWAFQLISLGMLAMGVFFTTRYIMKTFVYKIEQTDTGADLTVTEIQGRHVITVCRISLSGIEQVISVCPNDRPTFNEALTRAKSGGRKMYNYCADMFGDLCLFVLANECGEAVSVRLSYDEKLCELLCVSDGKSTDGEEE